MPQVESSTGLAQSGQADGSPQHQASHGSVISLPVSSIVNSWFGSQSHVSQSSLRYLYWT